MLYVQQHQQFAMVLIIPSLRVQYNSSSRGSEMKRLALFILHLKLFEREREKKTLMRQIVFRIFSLRFHFTHPHTLTYTHHLVNNLARLNVN